MAQLKEWWLTMWCPIGEIAFHGDKISMFDEFKKDDGIHAGFFLFRPQ